MIKESNCKWVLVRGSICDRNLIVDVFNNYQPSIVVNLAAQAGVRYSIKNPDAYMNSNIIGFYNILEACRRSYESDYRGVLHLVYASSSSVYGGNTKVPFSTEDNADHPVSLYAAKKNAMSYWLTVILNSTIFRVPGSDSLPFMGLPDVLIWHIFLLLTN